MDKAYEPQIHDIKWQKFWESIGLAKPENSVKNHPKPSGKTFTIVMPPPNVTGVLHQGHALGMSLEDALCRWRRMCGDEVLYLPGTDHASIAVNMSVARMLQEKKGIDYRTLGREGFLKECWAWIEDYRPRIFDQIKRLGTSCDWGRVQFTMDPRLNKAVNYAFVDLYKKGLIYRAERLVNWSPKGQTGLSDLEVVNEEREGHLWHIRYPILGENEFLVVATTRPETLLGDTAVAVHPEDNRFKKYIGKKALVPFTGREIPIIGDSFVDREFGTGAVKITPAHDHNDFEVGERHRLPRINIFTKTAQIVEGLSGEAKIFSGLDRFVARKLICEKLEEKGLLLKVEKHKLRLGLSERWGDVVEPYLSTQWYLKMSGMAKRALDAARDNEIEIVPEEFKNQWNRWLENIHDWCVSRQLWWGQQIPAYHCKKCLHVQVSEQRVTVCNQCHSSEVVQDSDVLDTWFSSGLWPFSTLGWPDKNSADFKKFYPTQVMETGFDILFFWVARMVMMGLEFTDRLPFTKVFLHPMVRDEKGQKMSKTKGNVKDPLEIAQKYGADTLRMTLNALCVQGRDLKLGDERIESYRNFNNKVWNLVKFALLDNSVADDSWRVRPQVKTTVEKWILNRLDSVAREVDACWSHYRMQEASELIYHFIWTDLCDWFVECIKSNRSAYQKTLLYVVGEALKMLHPICPHVTEELWHELPRVKSQESLGWQVFPSGESFGDPVATAEFEFVKSFIGSIRTVRAENKVPLAKKLTLHVWVRPEIESTLRVIKKESALIEALAKIEGIVYLPVQDKKEGLAQTVISGFEKGSTFEWAVPMSELVNIEEEKQRLKKEFENVKKLYESQKNKLLNESFVSRAPAEVIAKERLKEKELEEKLQKTEQAIKALS
jgi:valyl-tRNA synthetase